MTNKEISKIFEIPLSTINDWQKEDSNRHKLYQFLHAMDIKNVKDITVQQENHRLFHILNRNIDKKKIYTVKDVQRAFSYKDYYEATIREQVIYSKFFKECDSADLSTLKTLLNISIRNVKQIYLSSPLRRFKGVREVWDKRFRVHANEIFDAPVNNMAASALSMILKKRAALV